MAAKDAKPAAKAAAAPAPPPKPTVPEVPAPKAKLADESREVRFLCPVPSKQYAAVALPWDCITKVPRSNADGRQQLAVAISLTHIEPATHDRAWLPSANTDAHPSHPLAPFSHHIVVHARTPIRCPQVASAEVSFLRDLHEVRKMAASLAVTVQHLTRGGGFEEAVAGAAGGGATAGAAPGGYKAVAADVIALGRRTAALRGQMGRANKVRAELRVKREETVWGVREARKRWCLHEKSELVDEQKQE